MLVEAIGHVGGAGTYRAIASEDTLKVTIIDVEKKHSAGSHVGRKWREEEWVIAVT